jgi:hypothetical protein
MNADIWWSHQGLGGHEWLWGSSYLAFDPFPCKHKAFKGSNPPEGCNMRYEQVEPKMDTPKVEWHG